MVQTGYRENRDPRTISGLEKDMRCELVSREYLSVLPPRQKPSQASVLMPLACPLRLLLLRMSSTLRPAQPCLHPQASWT